LASSNIEGDKMTFKIKLLIVDDEAQFRATTKKILDRRGFDTILAGSGEEAIEMLESSRMWWCLISKCPAWTAMKHLRKSKTVPQKHR
jgi:CheY-like chemotaxis protein